MSIDLFGYIKNSLPILEVINDFVQLRQAGHYWKGSCPFHSETDASFTVSPDKQIFYCFGCHASGDVIAFIAKRENSSQIEAAKFIIDRYNVNVPLDILKGAQKAFQNDNIDDKNRYFFVYERFSQWCHQALLKSQLALSYVHSRQLSDAIIKNFSIGYLPGGLQAMQHLVSAMAQDGILAKDLITFGIIGEKKSYFYSPFEERILFPIKDPVGRVCALGGRVFKPGDDRPKYYNSRESEWFIKGKTLYGLDTARKYIQETGVAFLVEGYMDCVVMAQNKFKNTVATLGTACTLEHLKLLSRYAKTLYFLYDGDGAGLAAILRVTQLCWEVDLDVMVVLLPAKEDPASFLSKSGDLHGLVAQAKNIIQFFVSMHLKDFRSKPLSVKLSSVYKIFEIICKLQDPLKRDLLLQQTALAIDLPFQSIKDGFIYYARSSSLRKTTTDSQLVESEDLNGGIDAEIMDTSKLEQKILYAIITNLQIPGFFIEAELIPYFSFQIQAILKKVCRQDVSLDNLRDDEFLLGLLTEDERNIVNQSRVLFNAPVTVAMFNQLKAFFCKFHWKKIARDFKEKIAESQKENNNERMQGLIKMFSQLKQGFADKGLL